MSEAHRAALWVQTFLYLLFGVPMLMGIVNDAKPSDWSTWLMCLIAGLFLAGAAISTLRATLLADPADKPVPGEQLLASVSDISKDLWSRLFVGTWVTGIMGTAAAVFPLVPLLIAIIGLLFLISGIRTALFRHRHGEPLLALEASGIAGGGAFSAELQRGGKVPAIAGGTVRVRCGDWYRQGKKLKESVAWEESSPLVAMAGQDRLAICGTTRSEIPRAAEPDGGGRFVKREWRLTVREENAQTGFEAEFILPVREAEPDSGQQVS
jgi:hypothetical protein